MLSAFWMDSTLNKNGSCPPYRSVISCPISSLLSCTRSSRVRWVSKSLEGRERWVPIQSWKYGWPMSVFQTYWYSDDKEKRIDHLTSAYGFVDSIEKSGCAVAAAYLAAVDWDPTLPMAGGWLVRRNIATIRSRQRFTDPNRSCSRLCTHYKISLWSFS